MIPIFFYNYLFIFLLKIVFFIKYEIFIIKMTRWKILFYLYSLFYVLHKYV